MPAALEGSLVRLDDEREASTLYNKGAFGTPRSGGGLDLDLVEAAYLVEHNRLEVHERGRPVDLARLLARGAADGGLFEIRWHVYRDLRGRSLAVKAASPGDFQIYDRGGLPGRDPATHVVHALRERDALAPGTFVAEARRAAQFEKRTLASLVDEEGDVTYYEATVEEPKGQLPPRIADLPGEALLLSDRVLVVDELLRVELAKEHYGRAAGPALELSLTEAAYLATHARLAVRDAAGGKLADAATLAARAASGQPDYAMRARAFADLRARGLVVKTGFKYGTHFRSYRGGPNEAHAPYLVHALDPATPVAWQDLAGFVRLSHGVRKTMLFWIDGALLKLAWTRP